jgi:hypothetical protein
VFSILLCHSGPYDEEQVYRFYEWNIIYSKEWDIIR